MNNHKLKRTDSMSVPSPISNKYDTPQKYASKISWEEEEAGQQSLKKRWEIDAEMMPPPPVPRGSFPSNKRPKFRKNEDLAHPKKKKIVNNIKPSEMIGQCPSKIIMLLYDFKNKEPFRLSMNVDKYSYYIFKIIEYAKEHKIELKVDNVILYCYKFLETDYEHKIEIIHDIKDKALEVCKEKSYCPFDNDSEKEKDTGDIKERYTDLLSVVKCGILKFNESRKLIICNKLLYDIINIIVNKSIELNKRINYEICGDLIEFKEANESDSMFLSIMESIV